MPTKHVGGPLLAFAVTITGVLLIIRCFTLYRYLMMARLPRTNHGESENDFRPCPTVRKLLKQTSRAIYTLLERARLRLHCTLRICVS